MLKKIKIIVDFYHRWRVEKSRNETSIQKKPYSECLIKTTVKTKEAKNGKV